MPLTHRRSRGPRVADGMRWREAMVRQSGTAVGPAAVSEKQVGALEERELVEQTPATHAVVSQ